MIVVKLKHPKNGTEEAGLPACPGFLRSQIKGLLGNILFGATMPRHRPPPVTLTFGALRAAQKPRAAGGNGKRREPPVRLQQSQIIGRIHLHHLGINQTRSLG